MKRTLSFFVWSCVALLGGWAYMVLATSRGEHINSVFILIAALSTYAIGFRFYSKWIAARVLTLNDRRATPCEVNDDGKDYVRTNKWIVFGHHFAAISGPGPLVGPVLAAQFGYLPGTLWILIGVVLGGAVQDFVILFCSMRRNGKSLGQMLKEELSSTAGYIGLAAIVAIMIILLAVLALVVVKALAESPWGVFTVAATIPIALFMGGYLRYWRIGKVMEASAIGVVLLLLAVWGGQFVHSDPVWAERFTFNALPLAWCIILYGLAASVLPVWLLLAPRDYLSTFMKLGTIFALAVGVVLVLPDLKMPATTKFVDGSGLVVAGKLFPFCFITIACGAISGFHTLISSGTTPKLITREHYSRTIGYGAMCLESLVAVMALIAACTLTPGVYLSMNIKGAGNDPAAVAIDSVKKVNAAGYPVTVAEMDKLADQIGEKTLFGRTGGAATLAVGMAQIFSTVVKGRWLDLWYHFAIMFEALFILTTLDAGTRVGRYLLQDVLGHVWKPLGDTRAVSSNVLASVLIVTGWGYFLIQGVRDPLGGINSLWPMFGIANQLLASIALCLGTTIILKMHLVPRLTGQATAYTPRPAYALITLLPLIWLLSVTLTAGYQKILDADPRIGFLSQVKVLKEKLPALQESLVAAERSTNPTAIAAAAKAVSVNRTLRFNASLNAVVASIFMVLVGLIVLLSVWEWTLLLLRHRPATLHESPPVWLPDYALAESRARPILGFLALGVTLAKELSGEAHVERAQQELHQRHCQCHNRPLFAALTTSDPAPSPEPRQDAQAAYLAAAEQRFNGINRCC